MFINLMHFDLFWSVIQQQTDFKQFTLNFKICQVETIKNQAIKKVRLLQIMNQFNLYQQEDNLRKIKMVEVIYICKQGKYPFGRGKQSQRAFTEYLLQAIDENQANKYRQVSSIVKKLDCPNIIRLEKVLKEDLCFHMIYEYHSKSLEQRLKELNNKEELANIFVELENVFGTLVDEKLKAQLYLQAMGVDQHNKLKVWVKPDQLEFLGNTDEPDKTIKSYLIEFYQIQRTRIHLEIQEIFETSEINVFQKNVKKTELQMQKVSGNNNHTNKGKMPNFVIEGNTLVFLNKSYDKIKHYTSQQNKSQKDQKQSISKSDQMEYQHRTESKGQLTQQNTQLISKTQQPDLTKMTVAEKVLYYKKQKQNSSQDDCSQYEKGKIIIKASSTNNVSKISLSKSLNNDQYLHIRTQIINKHKMKIITNNEVQVEGNYDDDLEIFARDKLAKIKEYRQEKNMTHDNSIEIGTKANTSGYSADIQKLLKQLQDNSFEQQKKEKYESEDINSKINHAKLKAKNLLQKYSEKLKK